MKHVCCVILMSFLLVAESKGSQLLQEIPHHLYMESLGECEECVSYTIIISDVPVDTSISNAFRQIAESFGKKHAGAIITWSDALTNYRFFKNQSCGPFTDLADKVVTFIDKSKPYCKSFPYEDQAQLIAMISIISSNIDDLENVQNETWRLQTKQSIETYAQENKIFDSLKQLAFDLIDYVGDAIVEYRNQD